MNQIEILTTHQVSAVLADNFDLALASTERVFDLLGKGQIRAPIKAYLQRQDNAHTADRLVALPAMVFESPPLIGTKIIGSHPDNTSRGLARASAVIVLNDPETMHPVAIMPGGLISAMRTMATAGLCVRKLLPDLKVLGLVGMGRLGNLAVKWLPQILPSIRLIRYFSRTECSEGHPPNALVERSDLKEVLSKSDAVIIATQAPIPYIGLADLGTAWVLINLSLMDCKPEVFMEADSIIVDNCPQAVAAKKVLKEVVENGSVRADRLQTISSLLAGEYLNLGNRVLVNPIGLGAQDVHLAHAVLQAVRVRGMVSRFDWD